MKRFVAIALLSAMVALSGCSSENGAQTPEKIPAMVLSGADKEKLAEFRKDLLSVGGLADKAVTLAGDELKNLVKGGKISLSLPGIIDKAKAECLLTGASMVKKAVPVALPPEAKRLFDEGKTGLLAANKAYAESFDAIKSFAADKNPLTLLEFRKKSSQAQGLYTAAAGKLRVVMEAAGVPL